MSSGAHIHYHIAQPRGSIARAITCATLLLIAALPAASQTPRPPRSSHALETYAALPIAFEANAGQSDHRVKFLAHAPNYTLFLTGDEAVLSLPTHAVHLKFLGVTSPASLTGRDLLPGKTNYFIGNDPKQWHTNVPNYSAVEYHSLYTGIDAVFHGDNRRLEFDFNIAPGADPRAIALEVEGAHHLRLNQSGDIILSLDHAPDVILDKPHIYQPTPAGPREIPGRYILTASNRIAFALGPYDRTQPLVIDPAIDYATYLGGGISQETYINAIAVDSSGDAYVTGSVSADTVLFPTTPGSYNPGPPPTSGSFSFISKLKPDGSGLVYSTYFGGLAPGGGGGGDQIFAIAVDSLGAAYFGGISETEDNTPTTPGAYEYIRPSLYPVPFVAKLSPDGSTLLYSTYLDGSSPGSDGDTVGGIAVDSLGSAYVTGVTTATNFPTTPGAFQTVYKASLYFGTAFVTKLSADGSSLVYSTFLGGSTGENDVQQIGGTASQGAIAVDSLGFAYVTGFTGSTDFPTTTGVYSTTCGSPCQDVFATKVNANGTGLVYSTFLGGGGAGNKFSVGRAIAVDSSGYAFVGGTTNTPTFPVTTGALQSSPGVGFITKLKTDGSGLTYSSYFGGYVMSVAVGTDDSAVLFGYSNTTLAFESTPDAFTIPGCPSRTGCFYGYLSKLTADGSGLLFSSPLGGDAECCTVAGALDPSGNAYIAESTSSQNIYTSPGSFEPSLPSNYTGFTPYVAKVAFSSSTPLTISPTTLAQGTAGVGYSQVNLSATGGTGTVTFAVTAGSLPPGMTLTSPGALFGTPTQTGTFPFTVTATDANSDTGSQAYSLQIGCPTITVGPSTLAPGTAGTPYGPVTFTETGGVGAIGYGITNTLPAGFNFVAGVLSGSTTTQTGSFPFIVTATDSNGCMGTVSDTLTINAAVSQPASVTDDEIILVSDTETFPDVADSEKITVTDIDTVRAYTAIAIAPGSLPSGLVGTPYSQTFTATGGSGGPYSFSVASGTALSAVRLTLSTAGTISGTPNASEAAAAFTLQVADSLGDITQQSYTLTVNTSTSTPAQVTDDETITVTDTDTFPDVADAEPITVTDTDAVRAFSAIAVTPTVTSFNASSGSGTAGQAYGPVRLTATGGTGALTLTESGSLPSGVTFNNGVLGGTLSASSAGTYTFSLTATDTYGDPAAVQQGYTLIIAAPPPPAPVASLSPTSLSFAAQVSGTTSVAQTATLSNTGNAALSITGTGIGISGANAADFAQTNPCGSTVAAGANCVISVTFKPSLSAGSETATLSVPDNASGSPQQVQLSGIALPPRSVSCIVPTVNLSGDAGTAQIPCTATTFIGTIALNCNLPASLSTYVTCSFSPSSLVFTSTVTQVSTTLSIQPVQGASIERKGWPGHPPAGMVALAAVLWLPTWAFVLRRKSARSQLGALMLLILLCGLQVITACGGGGSNEAATAPAGTYPASIVLTGPGLNETISFNIQVP